MKQARGPERRGHPALWATLTLAAFPIVALTCGWIGIDPFRSFAYGALASLIILLLEGVVRGRWWIAEPSIARLLGDPEFGSRLLVVLGMLLFVFETFLLAMFLTNTDMDGNIVQFILARQCAAPQSSFLARLCVANRVNDHSIDPGTAALREAAEKRFFASGEVTCAVRSLTLTCQPEACVQSAVVRCDQWNVGRLAGQPVSINAQERIVVAGERVQPDGTYLIDDWASDPADAAWNELGGPDALRALSMLHRNFHQTEISLQAETFRRIMERLQSH